MAEAQTQISKLEQLKVDAVLHRERLAAFDPAAFTTLEDLAKWVKNELAFQFVPMFEATVDAINEDIVPELIELGEQVDRIEEGLEDTLTPETADDILAVFDAGRAVCSLLEKATKHSDQVTKKRALDAIRAYRGLEVTMRDVVVGITMPDEAEPEAAGAPAAEAPETEPAADAAPEEPAAADATTPQGA